MCSLRKSLRPDEVSMLRKLLLPMAFVAILGGACADDDDSKDTGTQNPSLIDDDGDNFSLAEDCDDSNSSVYPGAIEICDGLDNDCDDSVDEGVTSTFYVDMDQDGFGSAESTVEACEKPEGYVPNSSDCDDANPDRFPGNTEICDSLDNDCDDSVDEGLSVDWWADTDADGYGDPLSWVSDCAQPVGYVSNSGDCDDSTDAAFPGAEEICDEIDNDCDGVVDDGVTSTFYLDADSDGWGIETESTEACWAPANYAAQPGDCDDTNPQAHPGAAETCNGIDDDCDGETDEDSADDALTWYRDADADGYGNPDAATSSCQQPTGYVADSSDCDDWNDTVNPAGTETCNGLDDDCDGMTDGDDATDATYWYRDADSDGYGDADRAELDCEQPSGYVSNDSDCDDSDSAVSPSGTEICDGTDNDCDGETDEDDSLDIATWFQDRDGDGFGNEAISTLSCDQPEGYVSDHSDCNDLRATTYPGAAEYCDGEDNDCDGETDEDSADDALTWFRDADADGFGSGESSTTACEAPEGYVEDSTDCDDSDPAVHPGADEYCNGLDDDCDGVTDGDGSVDPSTWYRDRDEDGFGDAATTTESCTQPDGYVADSSDCDDLEPLNFPGAVEHCDGVDNDCDGDIDEDSGDSFVWYEDVDGDGYGNPIVVDTSCEQPLGYVTNSSDCDDTDAWVYPGANEYCNGHDDDCDGETDEDSADDALPWYRDADTDTYGDPAVTMMACYQPRGYVADATDCDDTDAFVNPASTEICNGYDDDCDGDTDEDSAGDARTWYRDVDGDGYGDADHALEQCYEPSGYVADATDCDDLQADVHPGATEYCNGQDDNCNGDIDENSAVDAQTWYADSDLDGFGNPLVTQRACQQPSGFVSDDNDCDDSEPTTYPGAAELCDGADNDCDGSIDEDSAEDAATWYRDADGDHFGDPDDSLPSCFPLAGYVADSSDCDDTDAFVNPDSEELCDGVDNDCDGETDEDSATDASTWFRDLDGDGFGDADHSTVACYTPDDYVENPADCDDLESSTYPGATEYCDGVDNNCNDVVDEGAVDTSTWFQDSDGDGYGNVAIHTDSCEPPSGFVGDNTDCDDLESSTYPGAPEYCDGVDNDCDGITDEDSAEDATWWYADSDHDGYGDPTVGTVSCTAPPGYLEDSSDCDDALAEVNPAAAEYCNGMDDDCDGETDEDSAEDARTWNMDRDADGFGDPDITTVACYQPDGYVSNADDCDDLDPDSFPGGVEVCDGADNDCDGETDEAGALGETTWYGDSDGDGYGGTDFTVSACETPEGYVADNTDCNDLAADINPGATETCNGIDDDCDGETDEAGADGAPTWYADADADGFGDPDNTIDACSRPAGYLADASDCDDSDATIYPGALETCNGHDDDCDGETDEDDAAGAPTWFLDSDNDGYGDDDASTRACQQPEGYVAELGDCDDADSTINPGAAELCDEIDNDCDDLVDELPDLVYSLYYQDSDGDGYGDPGVSVNDCNFPDGYTDNPLDCDDSDPAINPDATEVCDGTDNNCDGTTDEFGAEGSTTWYADSDHDGYGDASSTLEACSEPPSYTSDKTDCDDTDSFIHPGADEHCDGVDNDCDGSIDEDAVDMSTWYMDRDEDSFGDSTTTTTACEQPDGYVDDPSDCDDLDAEVHVGATEYCNGYDDDCDGAVDEPGALGATTWYADGDGDGFGNIIATIESCDQPDGYITDSTDCNDLEAAINPDADEYCDGVDNDCDGVIDEDSALDVSTWYRDLDHDGYGDADSTTDACTAPVGFVTDSTDCDDTLFDVNPAASELCNGMDDDCDGEIDESSALDAITWYMDRDGDGFGDPDIDLVACDQPSMYVVNGSDCDDLEPEVYPGAPEYCNGIDDNCDGETDESPAVDMSSWYRDLDGDGYGDSGFELLSCDQPSGFIADGSDCDDLHAANHPGADEYCDGADNDCDGDIDESDALDVRTWYQDADADDFGNAEVETQACDKPDGYVRDSSDCDDASADVNPAAEEICEDGIDNDCDGRDASCTNTPPEVLSVELLPSRVYTNDTIHATVTTYDVDGDPVTVSYQWYVDGTLVDETSSNLDGSSYFDRDQVVYLTVTPNDGTDDGDPLTSTSLTVLDSVPTQPLLSISPEAPVAGVDDLLCRVDTESTDEDGDTVGYSVSWQVNGHIFPGTTSTTSLEGDTIAASDTSIGDTWACTVTPDDGTDSGTPGRASVVVGDDCLVAYYPFDEGSGSTAYDSSGNGLDGSVVGAGWASVGAGYAMEFYGEDDYVDLGNDSSFDIQDEITIEAWIYVEGSTGDHQVIAAKWYLDDSPDRAYVLELQPDGQTLQMPLEGIAGDGYSPAASSEPITLGEWVHVAGTYDGSTIRLYQDGVETGSYASPGTIPLSSASVFIGAHDAPSDRNPFNGMIDDLLIYCRALGPDEILDHYEGL